jgi:hypothetical protein
VSRSNPGINPNGEALKRLAVDVPRLNADMSRHALYSNDDLCGAIDSETDDACKYELNAEPRVTNDTAV